MPRKAYLTLDDSPSDNTIGLVDFLTARGIPALLFVRGDLLEQNPRPIEHAIRNGLMIGNHGFAHRPAGGMEPQDWANDLELCDHLIEAAYARCGIKRTAKYYRFPYIDRGDGKKIEQIDEGAIFENDKTQSLQDYLKEHGFRQPFQNMPPGYPTGAGDCLYTYTSRDWMLNDKHRGKHEIKTLDDLKARVDEDESLQNELHHHVIILHDQPGNYDEVCALIDYFGECGFEFMGV